MKRYTPIIESDSSCDMFASIEETINGTLVKYSEAEQLQEDLREAYESMIGIEYQFDSEFMDKIKLKYKALG